MICPSIVWDAGASYGCPAGSLRGSIPLSSIPIYLTSWMNKEIKQKTQSGANQNAIPPYKETNIMSDKDTLKPGETVDRSGIYTSTHSKQRTTLDRGDTASPTPQSGEKWKLTVETNPKKPKR